MITNQTIDRGRAALAAPDIPTHGRTTYTILTACMLCFLAGPGVAAPPPYDGGQACLDAQLAAQDAASTAHEEAGCTNDRGRCKGILVSAASDEIRPKVDDGSIKGRCPGCIMNQFGRSIAIEDQQYCGTGCGDTFVQEERGEQCDDGNREDGDGCSADCLFEVAECPVHAVETCDDIEQSARAECFNQLDDECDGVNGVIFDVPFLDPEFTLTFESCSVEVVCGGTCYFGLGCDPLANPNACDTFDVWKQTTAGPDDFAPILTPTEVDACNELYGAF